jgi:glyoxylase-like metal-dependent hydrolase (beta-lactamase superfamily II)
VSFIGALPPGVSFFERGWLSSNNVLLLGRNGNAMVDSGYVTHTGQTTALVGQLLAGKPLDLLLNTHLHSDHCGGNAALQRLFPLMRTLIPPGQFDFVRQWDPVALTYVPTGQQCDRFAAHDVLTPGSSVALGEQLWEIHASPGHDPHSVVLFEPVSRTLISADALWETGFGVVFEELEGVQAFDAVAQTLDLIESLAPTLVLPGHGPAFADANAAIAGARRRLDGFVSDPRRHGRHAAKVLLKFKLLELQRLPFGSLLAWAGQTAYFDLVHRRFFAEIPSAKWLEGLLGELVGSGAARRDADWICNA